MAIACEGMISLNLNPKAKVFEPITASSDVAFPVMLSSQTAMDITIKPSGMPSPPQTIEPVQDLGTQQVQQQVQQTKLQQQVQHPMQAVSILSQPSHRFGLDGSVQNAPMLVLCPWPQPNAETDPYAVPNLPPPTPMFVSTSSASSASSPFHLVQTPLQHSQHQVFQVVPPQSPTHASATTQQNANAGLAQAQVRG